MDSYEKIFVMIKPWVLGYYDEILADFEKIGPMTRLAFLKETSIERLDEMYQENRGYGFYEWFLKDHINQPSVIAVFEGELNKFLELKKSIRERFNSRVPQPLYYTRNAVHTSKNNEEFLECMRIWGDYFNN